MIRPDITLRQLRYFHALAEDLNYHRSAEKLFISQPALSAAIKHLEHQFGVVLFSRNTREVALTEVGQAWRAAVRDALAAVDAAVDGLVALGNAGRGYLRVGYLIGTGADLLFEVLRDFEAAYPEIAVEPSEFDFTDPTAGLGAGLTQIAMIRPPVDLARHRMVVLESEEWVACLPRDHRFAGREEVQIGELLDDPVIAAPASAGSWRDYWLAMDARGGKPPTIAATAATYEMETTLIARGLGISFTTQATARLYERPGVVYVPISDRPLSQLALAWNPASLTPEADLLLGHVQRRWKIEDGLERVS